MSSSIISAISPYSSFNLIPKYQPNANDKVHTKCIQQIHPINPLIQLHLHIEIIGLKLCYANTINLIKKQTYLTEVPIRGTSSVVNKRSKVIRTSTPLALKNYKNTPSYVAFDKNQENIFVVVKNCLEIFTKDKLKSYQFIRKIKLFTDKSKKVHFFTVFEDHIFILNQENKLIVCKADRERIFFEFPFENFIINALAVSSNKLFLGHHDEFISVEWSLKKIANVKLSGFKIDSLYSGDIRHLCAISDKEVYACYKTGVYLWKQGKDENWSSQLVCDIDAKITTICGSAIFVATPQGTINIYEKSKNTSPPKDTSTDKDSLDEFYSKRS